MYISLLNRISAFLILIIFIFTSCPTNGPSEERIIITPGEGDPRYVYLDDNGEFSTIDTGRTLLFIENNNNAKGVYVISDKLGTDSRVTLVNENNDSKISVYFKENSKFPYQMNITSGNDSCFALLSNYRSTTSTYDVILQDEDEIDILYDLVMNSSIFNLYEKDNNLNTDQNQRLQNITIALGVIGSISYYMDEAEIAALFLKKLFKAITKVVKAVFTAVAVVVAPLVSIFDPLTGAILYGTATAIIAISTIIIGNGTGVIIPPDDPQTPFNPTNTHVIIRNHYENRVFFNGEEYHIPTGSSVQLDFIIPGFNNNSLPPKLTVYPYDYPYVPGTQGPSNAMFFEDDTTKNGNSDEFQLIFKRALSGYIDKDKVKIAFGLLFDSNITINGETNNGIEFKLPTDEEPILHKDMVVIRFCVDPNCTQYVP